MSERDDDDLLAAELSLGLLSGADDDAARARARTDGGFAKRVARWAGQFAPLYDEIDPVSPPDALWSRIEQQTRTSAAANDNVLQQRLNRWRGYATAVTALAAMLAVVLLTRPLPTPVQPQRSAASRPLVASLSDEKKQLVLVASWDPDERHVVVGAAGLAASAGRSHEVWVIPADGKPRPVGLLPQRSEGTLEVSREVAPLMSAGATIAISVEPAGGSPTGLPTGPVIASGQLVRT